MNSDSLIAFPSSSQSFSALKYISLVSIYIKALHSSCAAFAVILVCFRGLFQALLTLCCCSSFGVSCPLIRADIMQGSQCMWKQPSRMQSLPLQQQRLHLSTFQIRTKKIFKMYLPTDKVPVYFKASVSLQEPWSCRNRSLCLVEKGLYCLATQTAANKKHRRWMSNQMQAVLCLEISRWKAQDPNTRACHKC